MESSERITDLGAQKVTLINGKEYQVRSLTFKEKKDYLKLINTEQKKTFDGLSKSDIDNLNEDVFGAYMHLQVSLALFLLQIMNPEITEKEVEENVNGQVLKSLIDIAFYDPLNVMKVENSAPARP